MLLVKLGILGFLGKNFYSSFLVAHLIQHSTQSIKNRLNKKLEESACLPLQD